MASKKKSLRYIPPLGRWAWDKLPDETREEYGLFIIYRDIPMAMERSLEIVYRIQQNREYDTDPIEVPRWFAVWKRKYYWDERSRAWDNHIQRERDRITCNEAQLWELRRQKSLTSAYEMSQKIKAKATAMIDSPLYETTTKDKDKTIVYTPAKWTFGMASTMARDSLEIEAAVFNAVAPDQETASVYELEAIRNARFEASAIAPEDGRSGDETTEG